jgi:hypothetical protein
MTDIRTRKRRKAIRETIEERKMELGTVTAASANVGR